MSYAGSNIGAVLKALEKELANTTPTGTAPVLCALGTQADAEQSSLDRITFVPKTRQQEAPHEQPDDGRAIAQAEIGCDAFVYGHDFEAANALADRLLLALYTAFSENAAQVYGRSGAINDGGAIAAASRFSIVVPVAFCVPVYAEQFHTGTGDGSAIGGGVVTNTMGTSPEAIP